MRLLPTLCAAALLVMPGMALAQRDPFAPAPRSEEPRRDDRTPPRGAVYAGDFVLVPHGEEMLMVDSKSGCIWRRTPRTQYDAGYWRFEFPGGNEAPCTERLNNARRAALIGNTQ